MYLRPFYLQGQEPKAALDGCRWLRHDPLRALFLTPAALEGACLCGAWSCCSSAPSYLAGLLPFGLESEALALLVAFPWSRRSGLLPCRRVGDA